MLLFTIVALSVSAVYAGQEQDSAAQVFYRKSSQKTFEGPAAHFTGDVRVVMLFPENDTAQYSGAHVTFAPGARTAWHMHPAGQHMIVTSGVALTGTPDGKVIAFKEGETVWCPAGIDHWHGATPDAPMTHLVITGTQDGKNVVWKEKVTDEQYAHHEEAGHAPAGTRPDLRRSRSRLRPDGHDGGKQNANRSPIERSAALHRDHCRLHRER